jgi:MSHA pilin protein MshD
MNGRRHVGRRGEQGVTLIELVVTITIITIAVTGIIGALSQYAVRSTDRMVQQQAAAIASSYLDEIMQKPYNDPNGGIETTRDQFDNVGDYAGLPDNVVRDQQGVAIPGLAAYQVSVAIIPSTLPGLPGSGAAQLINVTVTHPSSGVTVLMSGYKTNY